MFQQGRAWEVGGDQFLFCPVCGQRLVITKITRSVRYNVKTGEEVVTFRGEVYCPRRLTGVGRWLGVLSEHYGSTDTIHHGTYTLYPITEPNDQTLREWVG